MSRIYAAVGVVASGLASALALAACSGTAPPAGRETYRAYCAQCHGPGGAGDGRAAAHLAEPPADLTALSLSNGGVFPTGHVMAKVYGYPGKQDFHTMPEFGPLLDGPKQIWVSKEGEEIMTPVALLELAGYLETLQR